jgi:RepB plasmid partitioning protein/ParB-like nuclease domain
MPNAVRAAFNLRGINIPIAQILPTKQVVTEEKKNATFRRVLSSIKEVGLIEPLIVYPQGSGKPIKYSLLDGNTRFEAMKRLGYENVPCLISTEDEGYTYNHKVNVVPPIQEHFMIMKAIQNGVSEERIALALAVDIQSIQQKRDLLSGICPEAVELLKNKSPSRDGFRQFRRVKPMRQIEMAELMVKNHNFTASYARCLVAATSDDQLVEPHKPKAPKGLKVEEVLSMEKEMESLEQNFLALGETHGKNTLHLVLMIAFLRKLLDNSTVARFLSNHHSDILAEFQKLIETTSLERSTG